MPQSFDPYYKWLGIPPKDQPANHYRLLSIELFEPDREVIDAASNRVMTYLKALATGEDLETAQKLLNEVSAARQCLLNPRKRAAYDVELKKSLGLSGDISAPIPPPPPPAGGASFDSVIRLEKSSSPSGKSPAAKATAAKASSAKPSSAKSSSRSPTRRPNPLLVALGLAKPARGSATEGEESKPGSEKLPQWLPLAALGAVILVALIVAGIMYVSGGDSGEAMRARVRDRDRAAKSEAGEQPKSNLADRPSVRSPEGPIQADPFRDVDPMSVIPHVDRLDPDKSPADTTGKKPPLPNEPTPKPGFPPNEKPAQSRGGPDKRPPINAEPPAQAKHPPPEKPKQPAAPAASPLPDPFQELPSILALKPLAEAEGTDQILGPLKLAGRTVNLNLMGGDEVLVEGRKFVLKREGQPGGRQWPVELIAEDGKTERVAHFSMDHENLHFAWQRGANQEAECLRNCCLKVTVGDETKLRLMRSPSTLAPLLVGGPKGQSSNDLPVDNWPEGVPPKVTVETVVGFPGFDKKEISQEAWKNDGTQFVLDEIDGNRIILGVSIGVPRAGAKKVKLDCQVLYALVNASPRPADPSRVEKDVKVTNQAFSNAQQEYARYTNWLKPEEKKKFDEQHKPSLDALAALKRQAAFLGRVSLLTKGKRSDVCLQVCIYAEVAGQRVILARTDVAKHGEPRKPKPSSKN